MNYVIIGLGGIIGANLRYLLAQIFFSANTFPWATLFANMIGAFVFGLLFHLFTHYKQSNWTLFVRTGIISSFTTFSAFSIEFILLIEDAAYINAFFYILSSVIFSLLAFMSGMKVMRR